LIAEEDMKSMNRLMRAASLCVLLVLTHGAARPAQEHTVLVGTAGGDTIAVDRYLRDETKLEGVLLVREPRPHTLHYKGTFAPEGRFALLEITWRDAAGNDMGSAKITFGVDSIRSRLKHTAIESFSAPPVLDAIPLPPKPYTRYAYSLLEHASIVITQSEMRDEGVMPWILMGARAADTLRTRRLSGNTYEIDYIDGSVRVQVGEDGRIARMDGTIDSIVFVVQRAAGDVDLAALTSSFASRDTLPRDESR
jgi:hypothetical protein